MTDLEISLTGVIALLVVYLALALLETRSLNRHIEAKNQMIAELFDMNDAAWKLTFETIETTAELFGTQRKEQPNE